MFICLSCSNNSLNQKIETHSRNIQIICLIGALAGAILFGISYHHFPPGSATGAILTSNPLRYIALSCFLAAILDALVLYKNSKTSNDKPTVITRTPPSKISDLLNEATACDKAKQYAKMIACYQEAAMLNSAEALTILGHFYMESDNPENPAYHGKGVTADKAKAFNYFSRAAEMTHPVAICELGHCYRFGWGVEKNEAQAFACYRKAFEELKYEYVAPYLAMCYENGIGTAQNLEKAKILQKKYPPLPII